MQTKLRKKKELLIYIDTNFILDCTEGRNTDSVLLMDRIREKKWKCVASVFSIMEISDVIKDGIFVTKKLQKHWTINKILRDRYKKDLNVNDFEDVENYIRNKVLNAYPFIILLNPSEAGWQTALHISAKSNLSAPDVIHLATAWDANCNTFITSDDQILKSAKKIVKDIPKLKRIQVYTPSQFLKLINKK